MTSKFSESIIQQHFFNWLKLQFPLAHAVTCSFPNAGRRSIANGRRMKAEGLKAGMPDVVMFVPTRAYHGMFIEFKSGKNKLTDFQKDMIAKLHGRGYYCCVCYSLESAIQEVRRYFDDNGGTV